MSSSSKDKLEKDFIDLENDLLKLKQDFFSIIKKFNKVKKGIGKKTVTNEKKKKKKEKKKKVINEDNFNEPILYKLDNNFCSILDIPQNTEITFSFLNQKVNEYLIKNKLINLSEEKNNEQPKIILNKELKTILKDSRTYKLSKLTCNNIHLYLKHNYTIKK